MANQMLQCSSTVIIYRNVIAVASLLCLGGLAAAQDPAPKAEFEVVSIKLNKSQDFRVMIRPTPGRFVAANIPLQLLLTLVYRLKDFQLSGAPAWLRSERYDIEAKTPGDVKASGPALIDAMVPMLQKLLEDRLQLRFHRETKDLPLYALTVVKPGKLHESVGECGPLPDKPPPPPEPGKLPALMCGGFMMFPGRLEANTASMNQIVDGLSRLSQRTVVDKTNLTGKYDIKLEWTPEEGQLPQLPGGGAGLPPLPTPDPNGPSLFTAVQEQLGLKLESQKGPVEIFVIDHIERPSEN
jgi:uncharacterized protein (TIGR03435 family)